MQLNNFKDIVDLAKKRCNISDTTEFDDIVNTAINNVYVELKKKEPYIATAMLQSINKVVTLPDDMDSIVTIEPNLNADEYRRGSSLILKKDNFYTIAYTVVPEPLGDTDVPELNRKYWYPMATYGCYAYYNYKKKHNEAQAYYAEYLRSVDEAKPKDDIQSQIQNVYSSLLR